jgi:transposase, IS5 family
LDITRYSKSKSAQRQQQVRAWFRTLIERGEWMVAIAVEFCRQFRSSQNIELAAVALELRSYLPSLQQVAAVARRVQVVGERVPAGEKVFSIFEPHTEPD